MLSMEECKLWSEGTEAHNHHGRDEVLPAELGVGTDVEKLTELESQALKTAG